ncbi:MAG: hypothetical protein HWD86_04995 [Kangiellaceae bacterium]|nr:hypothetical protein [Kangiellaceae bacterium]
MDKKIIGSLTLFALAIGSSIYFKQKSTITTETTTNSTTYIALETEAETVAESSSSLTSLKQNQTEVIIQEELTSETEQSTYLNDKFTQNSQEALKEFEQQQVTNASLSYTQERELYNLVTQEIYPKSEVLVLKDLKFECKVTVCKMTTSQYHFSELQSFFGHFFNTIEDKQISFTPVQMGAQETIILLYPPNK